MLSGTNKQMQKSLLEPLNMVTPVIMEATYCFCTNTKEKHFLGICSFSGMNEIHLGVQYPVLMTHPDLSDARACIEKQKTNVLAKTEKLCYTSVC